MSEAVSALEGATFDGFAQVKELGLRGMVTLRGDLRDKKLLAVVKKLTGVVVPPPRAILFKTDTGVAWMSPDELLVFAPYDRAADTVLALNAALDGTHFLAANVSDARAMFSVSGRGAREVIAKLSPADLSPAALQVGEIRRTRMAQTAAAVWMTADDALNIVCFRSVAGYMFNLLCNAAAPESEVNFF